MLIKHRQIKTYTTNQIEACLVSLNSGNSLKQVSKEFGIPRSTIGHWNKKYNDKQEYNLDKKEIILTLQKLIKYLEEKKNG